MLLRAAIVLIAVFFVTFFHKINFTKFLLFSLFVFMGIFSFFKRGNIENPNTSLANASIWGNGGSSSAGVTVNENNALTFSGYYRSLKLIGETIAQLPVKIYKKTSEGREEATDHPLYTILKREPNEYQSTFQFIETLQIGCAQHGNALAFIHRKPKSQQVESLEIIDQSTIEKVEIINGLLYYFTYNGKRLAARDLIHVQNFSTNGLWGKGWLEIAKETIGGALAEMYYSNSVFKNGGNLSGILTTDKTMSPEAAQKLGQQWRENYQGSDKAHKTAILFDGMKYQQLSITPEEAQLINSKRLSVEDMSRVSGIPAHLIGDNSRSTFNNIEQQSLEFVQYVVLPWVRKWEQELERKLLKTDEKNQFTIKFNIDGLLRGDVATRGEFYAKMIDRGVLTRNEVRELENKNKLEGLDKPLLPLNMVEENGTKNDK